jgi:hypothetical protein
MNPCERRREELTRHVIERVERDDRVERRWLELERREVRLDELGVWDSHPGALHLSLGDVDTGDLESSGQTLGIGHARTAAQLDYPCSILEAGHELSLPCSPRVADDPVTPLCKAIAHRVVGAPDKVSARIVHLTATRAGGYTGKITIDATNSLSGPREGFPSLAAEVKSIVGGPTAKSFNTNFANIYDKIATERRRPSNVFAAEPDAREVTEQLIRDAGFEPVFAGGLDAAPTIEAHIAYTMMLARSEIGPHFYRLAPLGEL